MKKRLIALMVGATITVAALTNCGSPRQNGHIPPDDLDVPTGESNEEKAKEEETIEEQMQNKDEIRHLLEQEIEAGLLLADAEKQTIDVEYVSRNQRYYISFYAKKWVIKNERGEYIKWAKIKYEVDKDFYDNFKEKYSEKAVAGNVELVRSLVERYNPRDLVYPAGIETVEK